MRQRINKMSIDNSITFAVILFVLILFSAIQIAAQETEKPIKKNTANIKLPNAPQSAGDVIEFKNETGNAIITITDEGSNKGSITLPQMTSAPTTTTLNKLYNEGGTLKFNGSTLGSGSGASLINGLSDAKTDAASIFLGSGAGASDDGGISDGIENNNVGIGIDALKFNTIGYDITAVGYQSLYTPSSTVSATAVGSQSLYSNSTGGVNTGVGTKSLYSNTSGNHNSALGANALFSNADGDFNIGIGNYANYYNQNGSKNTILGYDAGKGSSNHNKSGNVFIGYSAGYSEIGDNKLYIENSNSTSPLIWGDFENDNVRINGNFHVTGDITTDGTELWKENSQITRLNPSSNSLGIGTADGYQEAKLMVLGNDGVLFQGTFGSGYTSALNAGTRFHFYPKKAAIRSGYVNGLQWDDGNIGNYSTAFGQNTIASGNSSTASGFESTAIGNSSIALGYRNTSTGNRSMAIGSETDAKTFSSFAIGRFNSGVGSVSSWIDTDPLFEIGIGTSTIPSNAMTVLKNGKVGIGVSTTTSRVHINSETGENPLQVQVNSLNKLAVFSNGGTSIGTSATAPLNGLLVAGDAQKPGGGSWSVSSDIRLKDILGNYEKGLKQIDKLRTIKFRYKEKNPRNLPSNHTEYGFVAQDVEKVFPEAVTEDKDGYLSFNIHPINVAMINAVQELSDLNEDLKNMLIKLKKENKKLETRLTNLESRSDKKYVMTKK